MILSGNNPQHARTNGGSRFILLAAAFVLLPVLVVLLALSGCGSRPKEGEATIHIAPGTSAAQIARMLVDENVIDDEGDFMDRARATGVAAELKAGTYRFQRGESIDSILSTLQQGLQAPESFITVPEGFSLADTATLVATKTSVTESEYTSAAQGQAVTLPLAGAGGAENLEGFLFPSTYDLDPQITADDLVNKQLVKFDEKAAPLFAAAKPKPATSGLTQYQLLTVASMVEREAKVPEERPLIAAVIYNRIAIGMKLEVDATVQYAVGSWKLDLTQDDLNIDSPYNTRLYNGLPPGPICNPGLDSIRAALDPAPVDYIYYVAKGDEAGHHFFTSSYDEFLEAQAGSTP